MLYTIWQRYEYWSNEGVKWTKWFQLFNVKPTENKDELKEKLKTIKENNKHVIIYKELIKILNRNYSLSMMRVNMKN